MGCVRTYHSWTFCGQPSLKRHDSSCCMFLLLVFLPLRFFTCRAMSGKDKPCTSRNTTTFRWLRKSNPFGCTLSVTTTIGTPSTTLAWASVVQARVLWKSWSGNPTVTASESLGYKATYPKSLNNMLNSFWVWSDNPALPSPRAPVWAATALLSELLNPWVAKPPVPDPMPKYYLWSDNPALPSPRAPVWAATALLSELLNPWVTKPPVPQTSIGQNKAARKWSPQQSFSLPRSEH